ncbi:MAG: hypothetical protein JSV96_12405 [Candidatus Aminicenantes bacterium]|nr:MAG: hypothetical protein JSV96_12405 [Candidatus Aminicenantes bacterium]
MNDQFKKLEEAFEELKRKFRQDEISRGEFIDELKKLSLKDEKGRFWMIGSQSGKWYYFDGNNWIQSEPPSIQEGVAICIYCGFENMLESVLCVRCGQNLVEEEFFCKNCGIKLDAPDQDCPTCSGELGDIVKEEKDDEEEDLTKEEEEKEKNFNRREEDLGDEEDKTEDKLIDKKVEEVVKDESVANFVFRSLSPISFLLFWGILGLLAGIILGAFTGATDYFYEIGKIVPSFLKGFQGKLLGGIIYSIVGGVVGFIIFGVFGFCLTYLINFSLSLIGGIKVRIEKS